MPITFLGLPNIAARGSAFVTALGPEPVTGEAAKLKNDEPSDTARMTSYVTPVVRWRLDTYGDLFDLDGAALVNHNLTPWGYIRLVEPVYSALVLQPDGTTAGAFINATPVGHSNVAGTIGSPNGTFVGPSNPALSWQAHFTFAAPSVAVRQGTAMAQFILDVYSGSTAGVRYYPSIVVELWDNSGFIRRLGMKAITAGINGAGYQTLVYPFAPAECTASSNLQFVEVRIKGYPGDGGVGCFIDTLVVGWERDDAPHIPAFDSGWVSVGNPFLQIRDGLAPTRSNHVLFDSTVAQIRYCDLKVLDDGAQLDPPLAGAYGAADSALAAGLSLIPSGYLEGGMWIVGPKLEVTPGIQASAPAEFGVDTARVSNETEAGQSYGSDAYSSRSVPSELEIVCSRDQMMELLARIGWQKGHSGVFYVILDPDVGSDYGLFSSFACVSTGIKATLMNRGQTRAQDLFLVRLGIKEKL